MVMLYTHTGLALALPFLTLEQTHSSADNDKCKLYLAKSTIPNAGLGVFTGIDLSTDDAIG